MSILEKVKRRLSPALRKDEFLRVAGVFDGSYAFRGPEFVQIDLTDYCNNQCLACWCNSPLLKDEKFSEKNPRKVLSLKLAKTLIDELAAMGTNEISFSGGGEPFMHPDIMEIIAYTKKKRLSCLINTNFTLVDKECIDEMIALGVDSITVSVWAATSKTYLLTHPNKTEADFGRIKENLIYLAENKKERPRIHLYNVIFNKNFTEFEDMVQFALDTKAEMIGFALVDTVPGSTDTLILNDNQLHFINDVCRKIKARLDKSGRLKGARLLFYRFDDFVRRVSNKDFAMQAKYDKNIIDSLPCYNGWLFARVVSNGEVHSC
ncbi:MAG TPA: radical SAM protein, partial [Candidatus Omnitrophota bacterium]|nr:radical SAM protein [Candidatus Omnitrophota bacterium]